MVKDVIRLNNRFYVLATSSLADERTRVLKYGETFAVFNPFGDIERLGLMGQGLYHRDTRHLSRLVFRLGNQAPQVLRSTIRDDNAFLTTDMMNLDIVRGDRVVVPRGSIHVFRSKFLWRDVCYEHLRIANYSLEPVETAVALFFEADFADIFEVRGTPKRDGGTRLPADVQPDEVCMSYRGTDGRTLMTRLHFWPAPERLSEDQATFQISLGRREEFSVYVSVGCYAQGRLPEIQTFEQAFQEWDHARETTRGNSWHISTSNSRFNSWLARSEADLQMMTAGNPEGEYPYAGVPWFSTVFGRDGIITARECLSFAPEMARSVLEVLAQTQATEVCPEDESEPGKIVHEMRRGEMANTKEVPFGRYYGSVDATPLFVMLSGDYLRRTGDQMFLKSIWPNILAALDWIDTYGDADHDGFVEYQAKSTDGLTQQGWKDSRDSIFHSDGTIAQPPIALCEVQAYVYAAKRGAAEIAESLGDPQRAAKLREEAQALRAKFESDFWSDTLGMYAIALDGQKRRCEVRASNAGHCLFGQIASPERATRVMNALLGPELFGGWGIRTLGTKESRYNPMSYHNGTVWPHDNALIGRGLANYGFWEGLLLMLDGLFETSVYMDLHRLPELFCGFHRRNGAEGPTLYPVACSPQAWAAGAVFLLLEACLGLQIIPQERCIRFHTPHLPHSVDEMAIDNLPVGDASASIVIRREPRNQVRIEAATPHSGVTIDIVDS